MATVSRDFLLGALTGGRAREPHTYERLSADTYADGEFRQDGRPGRLRPTPRKLTSGDFARLRRGGATRRTNGQ